MVNELFNPQFNLQYLRYYLGFKIEATAHAATGDNLVTEMLFKRLCGWFQKNGNDNPTEEMIRINSEPILSARMPFGKHKGVRFGEAPVDYLAWLNAGDLDKDLAFTVRHYLGQG